MKNLFSKKLFIEALRQIRTPFALLFTLIAGGTGFITITHLISAIYNYRIEKTVSFAFVSDILCLLPFTFVIAIPLFTFKLFKFLTKRNASDFYHAIPFKRNCIMFTYIIAILSAIIVILLVSTMIPLITFSLSEKYISFNFYEAYPFVINMFACSLLTLSICLLSGSMTGTLITTILFALAIMFGPRIIIFSVTETILDSLGELITYNYDFGIFNSDVNLLFSGLSSFMYGFNSNLYTLSFSTVYTFILSIIYTALAFWAFNKRKSEQAENTGRNPIAQHSMRIALGYFFFHMAVTNVYFYYDYSETNIDYIIEIAILIIVGIAAMIIFELITSRKVKNLIHCFISIPIAAVLCFFTFLAISLTTNNILNYTPDKDKLDSIQYISISSDYYDDFETRYFEKKASEVKISNSEIKELVIDAYLEELEVFKNNYRKEEFHYDLSEVMNKHDRIKICFNDGLSSEIRYVYFNENEYTRFHLLLNNDEKYSSIYHSLPDDFETEYSSPNLTTDELEEIIKVLKSEYKNIPVDVLANRFGEHYMYSNDICTIDCATVEDSTKYYFSININKELPKTYEVFLDIMDKRVVNNKDEINYINNLANSIEDYYTDTTHANINLDIYDLEKTTFIGNISLNSYTEAEIKEGYYEFGYKDYEEYQNDFSKFLTSSGNSTNAKYIVFVNMSLYYEDDYVSKGTTFYSNDTEFIKKISNYIY